MIKTGKGGGAGRRPRLVGAIAFGVLGTAVLLALMIWQIQRLAWKEDLIATLEARLSAPPMALPEAPDQAAQEFRRVTLRGHFSGAVGAHGFADAAYLTTERPWGPGYRVVQPFETAGGRTILVDRGFVPVAEKNVAARASRPVPAPAGDIALTGALRWPQAGDFFADASAGHADNVWLTRSVDRLAPLFGAEPVLVVAETSTAAGAWPKPLPVTIDLPNDHLGYALTWGMLAAAWAGMSALLVRRERRRAGSAGARGP
jgi:surfeit locus 1 family protein